MNKFISLLLMAMLLSFNSGCSLFHVHKRDIEQGNVISEQEIAKLHRGMTSQQVKQTLGAPLLTNIFTPNRMEYVYTFQAGNEKMQVKRVSCVFHNHRLRDIVVS